MTSTHVTDADAASGSVGVVLVAAGSGSRLGADKPKAFVPIDEDPILLHAIYAVHGVQEVAALAIVAPPEWLEAAQELVDLHLGCPCFTTTVVAGGAERTDSVRAGLDALPGDLDIILVHDAARALTPVEVFDRVIHAVGAGAAGAVPGIPVVDTVKTVDARGVITGTPDRARLRAIQTPQGFAAGILRDAYATGLTATDDAALVELAGHDVVVVDGDPLAFKITTAEDLDRAARLVAEGS